MSTETIFNPQNLIETGDAWKLEGSVGRACMDAIEDGIAVLGATDHRDYWGNHVPSRTQVKEGTKGSVTYALGRLERLLDQAPDSLEEEDLRIARDTILRLECPDCLNSYGTHDEGCDTCADVKELL